MDTIPFTCYNVADPAMATRATFAPSRTPPETPRRLVLLAGHRLSQDTPPPPRGAPNRLSHLNRSLVINTSPLVSLHSFPIGARPLAPR
ncbi:hypothetical protein BO70DRAFT_28147 [Aspergillus heteromorphus CBS 117.55]|uniref:Uncharacterized protein n=1 Tax=Aspergillus heteromorphus CBS 117.55 TaxID=1448321 RepID=A0A317WE18_9EURO|nr:uncharacterized protein BO70DRAFT_28147 [Aspergillus heteromorphus CBS 117.55]PWY83547.1 hypothetical protein BO70DRAFT_28147 [Aspergillus heteromorphus CBS 117.55]